MSFIINTMRYELRKKFLISGLFIIVLIIFLQPVINKKRSYTVIDTEYILSNLIADTSRNYTSAALTYCDYYDIVKEDSTLSMIKVDGDLNDGHKIIEGGEYAPEECRAKFSTAVIIPFRGRAEQLRGFLVYMHLFLRRQQIHYRIYVVEQIDSKAYNRAKLMNIGAVTAMRAGYPCLVLHDMDLLPLRPSNLYACTTLPRHMSTNIKTYSFGMPNLNDFGGAISITSKQFQTINGMSNNFYGVDGDFDDLYDRLKTFKMRLCTYDKKTSLYHMSTNQHQRISENRKILSGYSKQKTMVSDGISSLRYTEVSTVLHPLFTHIMVDL